MKKLLAVTIIVLLCIAAFNSLDHSWGNDFYMNVDGDEFDGPVGAVLSVLFAGGGLLIGAVVILCAAVFVGLLFAGLGMLLVLLLAAIAVALVCALSPLLLPLAIVVGIVWFFSRRSRALREALQGAAV